MDCTIHDIATARYIAGSEIVEVSTTATANDKGFAEFDDVDTVLVSVKFANGAIGQIENSRFAAYGHDTQAEVFGSLGKVHCGPNLADTVVLATGDGLQMDTYLAHIDRYEYTFALEMEAFVERVREGAATPEERAADGLDGTAAVAVARAMKESLDAGRPVAVEGF